MNFSLIIYICYQDVCVVDGFYQVGLGLATDHQGKHQPEEHGHRQCHIAPKQELLDSFSVVSVHGIEGINMFSYLLYLVC